MAVVWHKWLLVCRTCGQEAQFVSVEADPRVGSLSCSQGHVDWRREVGTWEWPKPDHTHPRRADGTLEHRELIR